MHWRGCNELSRFHNGIHSRLYTYPTSKYYRGIGELAMNTFLKGFLDAVAYLSVAFGLYGGAVIIAAAILT